MAEQWQRADALMSRVIALEAWLEEDLVGHFAHLLDAALDRDPHGAYERQRRLYACEITEGGLTPIPHDAHDARETHTAEGADQSPAPVSSGNGSGSALPVPARAAA